MQPQSSLTSLESFRFLSAKDIYTSPQSSDKGLPDEDATMRKKVMANTLKATSRVSGFLLFLLQFKSPFTLLL